MSTLTLAGIVFSGTSGPGWVFQDLTDWYTLSDDKNPDEEKSQAHGAFGVSKSWRSSAAPSFRAAYLGDSEAEMLAAGEMVIAAVADGPVEMVVADSLRATSRMVTVRAAPMTDHHGRSTGEFAFDCLARDPRRYGEAVESSTGLPTSGTGVVFPMVFPLDFGTPGEPGRIEMTNLGKAPTVPTLTVSDGLGSATLTEIGSGKRLVFERPIPVGSVVTFNLKSRRVLIDGQSDVTGFLSVREWWSIGPGETSIVQFTGTSPVGTPTLTGSIKSAWW